MRGHRRWKIGWAVLLTLILFGGGHSASAQKTSPAQYAALLPLVANDPVVYVSDFEPHSQITGDYRMIGEVTSLATVPIYDVVVGLRGDYQGVPNTYFVPSLYPATLPGQINLFEFNLDIPFLENAELFIEDWSMNSDTLYAAALVEDIAVTGCCGHIFIDATITNNSPHALWNVQATPWSLEQAYQFDRYPIVGYLAAGESVETSMEMFGAPWFAPIHVIAQGEVHP